ncbi:MAG TPA: alternative ribosome rescue aminoacyl-tRNA hydrolase ArfB [Bacteroidota bacterium]
MVRRSTKIFNTSDYPLDSLIVITRSLSIPASDLSFRFSRAGGPGGQNVNKVASKVELLFDVARSKALDAGQRRSLLERLSPRIDSAGVMHIAVDTSRSQWTNRELAVARFRSLVAQALRPVRKRIPVAPTAGSRERRISAKKTRGTIKSLRRRVQPED